MATHAEKPQVQESGRNAEPKLTLDRLLRYAKDRGTVPQLSGADARAAFVRFQSLPEKGIQIGDEFWNVFGVEEGDGQRVVILREQGAKPRTVKVDVATLAHIEKVYNAIDESERKAGKVSSNVVKTGVKPTPVLVEEVPDEEPEAEKKPRHSLKMRYGAVDISEAVEERARDAAEESLHAEKKEAGFFAKFLKHNILYDVYRQVAISRSRSKILGEKNVYAADGLDREAHKRATGAVVDRFVAEYHESLHDNGKKGESRTTLGKSKEEDEVRANLATLIREYAINPAMDVGELEDRKNAIFAAANRFAGESKGNSVMYADNLERIAEEVRTQAAAAGGLENLDLELEIVVGKAKLGARTEREKNLVDSALEKLERWGKDKNVVGGILSAFRNEIAVAVGATYALSQIGLRMGLSSTAGKIMTFGGTAMVSGVYGWWKEKGRLNSERALHERQMALGGETRNNDSEEEKEKNILAVEQKLAAVKWWQPLEKTRLNKELSDLKNNVVPQPRRKEMEGFELQRASAKDMIAGAKGFMDPTGKELRSVEDMASATAMLAEIEARIRVSNFRNVDLLKYSSIADVEVERRDLDIARMQLKAALRATYDGSAAIDKNEFADFQTYFNAIYGLAEGHFSDKNSSAEVQKKKFDAWAQRQAVKRGLTTVAIGASVGVVAHDLWALGTGGDTTIGSIWDSLKAYFGHAPGMVQGPSNVEAIGSGMFKTPSGTDLVPQKDGTFVLESVADHKVLASNLRIDSAGNLSAASEKALRGIGATIIESDHVLNGASFTTATQKTWDWIHSHAPLVSKVHRDSWMGNDTPMGSITSSRSYDNGVVKILSVKLFGADFNELKLDWGNGMGVNHNGDFVMDMSKMTSDGSWNGGNAVDAPAELVQGKVRLLLSMNSGSQNHVVEVIVNSKGQAIIPAGSDVAKTFFREVNGKAVFIGKYAEIGVSKGYDAHGVDHLDILATHVGKGITSGVTTTTVGETVSQHVTTICLPSESSIIVPPFIPLRRRTPMEPLKKRKEGGDSAGAYGDDYVDDGDIFPRQSSQSYIEDDVSDVGQNEKSKNSAGSYNDENGEYQDSEEYIESESLNTPGEKGEKDSVAKVKTASYNGDDMDAEEDGESGGSESSRRESLSGNSSNSKRSGSESVKTARKMGDTVPRTPNGPEFFGGSDNDDENGKGGQGPSSGEKFFTYGADSDAYDALKGAEVYDVDRETGYEKSEGSLDSQSEYFDEKLSYQSGDDAMYVVSENAESADQEKISLQEARDAVNEMESYVATWTPEYRRTIEEIIRSAEPMEEECKMSIALPAYQEGKNIYEALRNYVSIQVDDGGKPLDPHAFEVNVFLNRPNSKKSFDKATYDEIERFKRDNPDARVNLIWHTFAFETGGVKMGAIYKTAADSMLLRSLSRSNTIRKARQIFRTGGADAREKNPRFLSMVINAFDQDPALAQLRTESRQPKVALEKMPLFHVISTVESAMSKLYSQGKSNIGLGSYSARIYAQAKGFNEKDSLREEVNLSRRIRSVIQSENGKSSGKHLHVKNAIDDPRRGIEAMYRGVPYSQRYGTFMDDEAQRKMREFNWEKEIQKPIPSRLRLTPENLSRELSATFASYMRLAMRSGNVARELRQQGKNREEIQDAVNKLMRKKFNKLFTILGIGREGVDYTYDFSGSRDSWRVVVKNVKKLDALMLQRKFNYWEGYE